MKALLTGTHCTYGALKRDRSERRPDDEFEINAERASAFMRSGPNAAPIQSVGRNDTDKLNSNNDIEIDEDMDKKKSKRQVKPPTRFADEFGYYCISVNYCDAMSPENFQEAMNCDDANEWKAAMDREMNSLVENKTWTLVDKPTKDKK
ncbi:hypothetical protein EVAR_88899_1 [Eumeta japonica]|uniref:Retrovirus-related Pol polyprotein from transposon TNT 1-94 n=1 Tax=Eumeta variegata TaxID=151549 RepID=A0A4C1SJ40_EUMVA|nr:hypothetical protein EVAR_88899_1 [Eumeta japonica]